jgi:hypothetical protein
LGLFLLPKGQPGRRFADADKEATREASFGLFLLPPSLLFHQHAGVKIGITSICH